MRVAILRRAPKASFSMDVYADSLIRGLKEVRPDWEIIECSPIFHSDGNDTVHWFAGARKYYRRYWKYPRTLTQLDVDICHIIDHSDGDLSRWLKRHHRPNVVTCHDLINLIQPETFKGRARFPFISMASWKFAVRSMANASHIIAVSSYTKQDTVKWLSIDSNHITVVPNAVDTRFRPVSPSQSQHFRETLGLQTDQFCILNVGSNNARKNIATILAVVSQLHSSGFPIQFWKIGADFSLEQRDYIRAHHLETCVTYLGQPDEHQLITAYNAADCLLAPSLYEGFGLTVLEAMACGTAVITANVTSLPEVAGDAAILVEPLDIDAIAAAIRQLQAHPEQREQLRQKGLARVKHFTWSNTAEQVAQIYEKVVANSDR